MNDQIKTESASVWHTPCGRDWTDRTGHHVCRYTMDHRGLCVAQDGSHASIIGNEWVTFCPEGITAEIDPEDGTCWACGEVVIPPGVTDA